MTKNSEWYQAVGFVSGIYSTKDNQGTITLINGVSYPAVAIRKARFSISKVEQELKRFTVYPKIKKDINGNPNVTFQIIGWNDDTCKQDDWIIKGDWKFIPAYRFPVISVYRNKKNNERDSLKTNHIPVTWRSERSVPPWRYSSDKNKSSPIAFISCKCNLGTNKRFYLRELVSLSYDLPKRVKALTSNY